MSAIIATPSVIPACHQQYGAIDEYAFVNAYHSIERKNWTWDGLTSASFMSYMKRHAKLGEIQVYTVGGVLLKGPYLNNLRGKMYKYIDDRGNEVKTQCASADTPGVYVFDYAYIDDEQIARIDEFLECYRKADQKIDTVSEPFTAVPMRTLFARAKICTFEEFDKIAVHVLIRAIKMDFNWGMTLSIAKHIAWYSNDVYAWIQSVAVRHQVGLSGYIANKSAGF